MIEEDFGQGISEMRWREDGLYNNNAMLFGIHHEVPNYSKNYNEASRRVQLKPEVTFPLIMETIPPNILKRLPDRDLRKRPMHQSMYHNSPCITNTENLSILIIKSAAKLIRYRYWIGFVSKCRATELFLSIWPKFYTEPSPQTFVITYYQGRSPALSP